MIVQVEVAELARHLVTQGVADWQKEQEESRLAAMRQLKGAGGGGGSAAGSVGKENNCLLTQAGNMFWKQNMGVGVNRRLQIAGVADALSAHIMQLKSAEGALGTCNFS